MFPLMSQVPLAAEDPGKEIAKSLYGKPPTTAPTITAPASAPQYFGVHHPKRHLTFGIGRIKAPQIVHRSRPDGWRMQITFEPHWLQLALRRKSIRDFRECCR
jgi:hypothetical protein